MNLALEKLLTLRYVTTLAAPDDTIGPATRLASELPEILLDALRAGLRPTTGSTLDGAALAEMNGLRSRLAVNIDADWLAAEIRARTTSIGMIRFIRFGHRDNVIFDQDAWFDDSLERPGRSVIDG